MVPALDIDDSATWPREGVALLEEHGPAIAAERIAWLAHFDRDDRHAVPAPGKPVSEMVKGRLLDLIDGARLRLLHCTRSDRLDEIRAQGLRPLDPDALVAWLVGLGTRFSQVAAVADRLPGIVQRDLAPQVLARRDQVWFTQGRSVVASRGCRPFFSHAGGEFAGDVLEAAQPGLSDCLTHVGEPAVVVAAVPVYGWSPRIAAQLPEAMIGRWIHDRGLDPLSSDATFDVCIHKHVPADLIEDVVPLERFLAGAA